MSANAYPLLEEPTQPPEESNMKFKIRGFNNRSQLANQTTQGWKLTSEVSEINRLSVGIQELNHGVIAVFDSAADRGDIAFYDGHVFCKQVLAITLS